MGWMSSPKSVHGPDPVCGPIQGQWGKISIPLHGVSVAKAQYPDTGLRYMVVGEGVVAMLVRPVLNLLGSLLARWHSSGPVLIQIKLDDLWYTCTAVYPLRITALKAIFMFTYYMKKSNY